MIRAAQHLGDELQSPDSTFEAVKVCNAGSIEVQVGHVPKHPVVTALSLRNISLGSGGNKDGAVRGFGEPVRIVMHQAFEMILEQFRR